LGRGAKRDGKGHQENGKQANHGGVRVAGPDWKGNPPEENHGRTQMQGKAEMISVL
jgi:hypothetical protein